MLNPDCVGAIIFDWYNVSKNHFQPKIHIKVLNHTFQAVYDQCLSRVDLEKF